MSRIQYIAIISALLFLVSGTTVLAQSTATIKATVDKQKILIGEPLHLSVELNIPEQEAFHSIPIDSIAHFEFLQSPKIDTSNSSTGTRITAVYQLTSFDSGQWVIPPFNYSPSIVTAPIPIDVVFSDFNPDQDYHDIKDIIEVKAAKKMEWWWYLIFPVVVLLALTIYFNKKMKPVITTSPPVTIDSYKQAMESIQKLETVVATDKEFFTELVTIFRLYVFRKKKIVSLQKTTDDLVLQLQTAGLTTADHNQLAQALRLSDFVKFAQFLPAAEDRLHALQTIKHTIQEIEKIG